MKKYRFPTLRKLILSDEICFELEQKLHPYSKHSFGKIIYFAKGKHITHEGPNGGIFAQGEEKIHNAISFEVQTQVFDDVKKRMSTIYLLVWMGGYTKGSVFHCAWQYPHTISFNKKSLDDVARDIYGGLTNIFYDEIIDKDIIEFNEKSKECLLK